jgi:hypothetical protein
MKRIFQAGEMFPIPDGTLVSPFLNPLDANQNDLPAGLPPSLSMAAGQLNPGVQSKIHVHPFVSVVTWVVEGRLEVRMKGQRDTAPYSLGVPRQHAVLTEALTLFQLINSSESEAVRVLYIVTPAYVFDLEGDKVIYDDAFVLDHTWNEIFEQNWSVSMLGSLPMLAERRQLSLARIAKQRRAPQRSAPIS